MSGSPVAGRYSPSAIGAAVAVLAALVYANALRNGLVWDDPIVLNRQLLAFKSVGDLIFPPRNIPQFSPDYYRPLTTVSYLIDRAIGGSGPFMFHLSVVVYHVLTTYLVFRLGVLLFAGTPLNLVAAGLGAAMFAVHPIHTESVAWGAGRSDVLAGGFSVAAVVVYLHRRWPVMRRSIVAATLTFIAMLAKETAAPLLLLPASDFLLRTPSAPATERGGRGMRRRQRARTVHEPSHVWRAAPFAVAFGLYAALRYASLGSMLGPTSVASEHVTVRLLAALGMYLGKLLLPLRQCAYISDVPTSPVGLLTAGALLAAAVRLGVYLWRRGERAAVFLLVWMGVTLAPSLAIVVKIPAAPVAERYLYIPSVGFCLLVGYGVAAIAHRAQTRVARAAVAAVVAAVLGVLAVATLQRNAVWRTNLSLWEDTAAKNTTDGLPMRSLATAYQQMGDARKAAEYFQIALQRRNDQIGLFTIYNNLGSLAMVAQRLDEAEHHYQTALAINPTASEVLFNLGLIALTRATNDTKHDDSWRRDHARQAGQYFTQAATLSPLDPDIEVGLGQAASALDDRQSARQHYQRALELGLPPSRAAAVRERLAALD